MSSSQPQYRILLASSDPGVGGVAQYNYALLKGLGGLHCQVTYLQYGSSVDTDWIRAQYPQVHQVNINPDDPESLRQWLINPTTQPHLILCSNTNPFTNFALKAIALERHIPYIIIEGLVEPHLATQNAPYLHLLAQHYAHAHAVIAVSQDNLTLLHQHFRLPPDQGQVIHYGRPPEYFTPIDPTLRHDLRRAQNIPADAVVCFTAARIESRKGYQFQLAAIQALRHTERWDHLYFVWAGGGLFEPELETELKAQLETANAIDHVKFLGQIDTVQTWLNIADIFILPSQLEGMPLSIIEAMAKGLPVIATAVSGIPEQLGETGQLLADPKQDANQTIQDLIDTLTTWSQDAELRHDIGRACAARATQLFTEDRMLTETLTMIQSALQTPHDYISPGLAEVHPDAAFPHMIVGNPDTCNWPYLRRDIPHYWYVDQRQPTIGFLSRDEAHLLYNLARQFAGQRGLEIGCWMGWSACHLALAGLELDVIDPVLGDTTAYESVSQSLRAAGVLDRVNLIAGYSPQAVEALATEQQRRWSLLFIDGNHEHPGPLEDAIACEPLAAVDALVVFHDLAAPAVAQGLDYFRDRGWQTLVYQTMQIMGIAWRGNVQPVDHTPDPAVAWSLPPHLHGYNISGQITPSSPSNASPVRELIAQVAAFVAANANTTTQTSYKADQVLTVFQQLEQCVTNGIQEEGLHIARSVCLCLLARHREALAAAKLELQYHPHNQDAQLQVAQLEAMLGESAHLAPIPTRDRPWYTELPKSTLHSIQTASHNYAYRGIPMIKNPFDFALYPLLLWQIKPKTIIEIGSKDGGSAVWFGDLLDNFNIDGHIYSLDIVKVTQYNHPRVTFLEGDGRNLDQSFSPQFFTQLPRPLLVIEDADHTYETSYAVLNFFDQYLEPDEYIVIEDGIISDLIADPTYNTGPHRALRQFLTENHHYEIDHHFCDFFGYNLTWCTNGFLQKKARKNSAPLQLQFKPQTAQPSDLVQTTTPNFCIVIDGMFFQRYNTGIARVWRSLLSHWEKTEFAQHLIIIDRGGSAPRLDGLTYRTLPLHSYENPDIERQQLQQICDQENATLFISTYYTIPITTPSVFMAYDMIPEMLGADFNEPMWQEKHRAIEHAQAYIGISQNTLDDLVRCFPDAATKPRTVAHCGVEPIFTPAREGEIERFKQKYGIHKPYFILSAPGTGYKNAQLFFRAFAQLPTRLGFELVCTGNMGYLDDGLRAMVPGNTIHTLYLEDEELRLAFSGAIALVYPSRYEGFGLPVLEALACGCPIITSPIASLPEVAGEAAIYVNPDDEATMIAALCEVQNPRVRQSLRLAGLQQAQQFSWEKMAQTVEQALIMATVPVTNLSGTNYILTPDWSQSEDILNEVLSELFKTLAQQKNPMTLLFYAAAANAEDVNTLLTGIAFNLMMMEAVDLDEHLAIAILPPLHPVQWSALLPNIQGRIPLVCDDPEVVTLPPVQVLPVVQLPS